jgi:hypothetical protein
MQKYAPICKSDQNSQCGESWGHVSKFEGHSEWMPIYVASSNNIHFHKWSKEDKTLCYAQYLHCVINRIPSNYASRARHCAASFDTEESLRRAAADPCPVVRPKIALSNVGQRIYQWWTEWHKYLFHHASSSATCTFATGPGVTSK